MATPKKNANQKSTSRSKVWIIILICIIVLAGGSFTWYKFNQPLFYAYYYDTITNPYKAGDKMYLKEWLVDKNSAKDYSRFNVALYRLARPLSEDEVDQMSISLVEKSLIKKDLSSKKPYMAECGWAISTDSLCKYKSAFISNYSGSKISYIYFGTGNYFPRVFFAIHPIQKALIKETPIAAPSGYIFDDGTPFYLDSDNIKRQDSKSFREVK